MEFCNPFQANKTMIVRQAANALEILEYFARRLKPATPAEIAEDLGWPRSSTFKLVGTLASKGYLYEPRARGRSEEHTSELQSLMRSSYDVFCLQNKS